MKRFGLILLFTVPLMAAGVVALAGPGRERPATAAAGQAAATIYEWAPIPFPTGVTTGTPGSLAVHPTQAYTAYLATWAGLYQTTDAGQSWSRVATDTLGLIFHFAIAPGNPQRLYAVSWNSSLYRSDSGGSSWSLVASPPSICGLAVAPSNASRVYARGCGGNHAPAVFRSDDSGQSWITPTLAFTTYLDTLVVSPANSDVLIGADFDEVFRSADGGATWNKAPVGTRYFGRPVFDPQSPHTLYLGHWTGLLRSADGGATWQDSDAGREFTAVIASPYLSGEALGGDDASSWRLTSNGNAWRAAAWNAPLPLQALWRSVSDNRVIYARSASGLWRYVARTPAFSAAVYLPVIQRADPGGPFPLAARQALSQTNVYRARSGVLPLQLHSAIVAAAQNHATYHMLNYADPSAWANGPHGEVAGKPGFTGTWPSDRVAVAGFPWGGGSEIMHFIGDPIASVDGWMATIYHRVIMLDPGAHYTGYGNGRDASTAVDVMDFGGGPTDAGTWSSVLYPLAYPADGQSNVPTSWSGGESPDPLPPGAPRPVGYPFTLQGVGGALQVGSATLRNGNGQTVATHPNPPDCPAFNCFALIAVQPLQPNTTYTVQAQGSVGGVTFNRTWTFTTGSTTGLSRTLDEDSPERIGPPHRQP